MSKSSKENLQSKQPSAGFPRVEKLIDSEDFTEVNEAFESIYLSHQKVAKSKKGLKKGRDSEKVMKSLENVMNLLKELLQIKYLMEQGEKKGAKPKK